MSLFRYNVKYTIHNQDDPMSLSTTIYAANPEAARIKVTDSANLLMDSYRTPITFIIRKSRKK